jgi:hypothetical protein
MRHFSLVHPFFIKKLQILLGRSHILRTNYENPFKPFDTKFRQTHVYHEDGIRSSKIISISRLFIGVNGKDKVVPMRN